MLRKVWEQQFIIDSENKNTKGPRLRKEDEQTTAASEMIVNPHDPDARLGNKRGNQHKGYKTHITETCDKNYPNLISHIETTLATTTDVEVRPVIEQHLQDKGCSPKKHLVDGGYTDVESMVEAAHRGIDVIGPMPMPTTWQDKAGQGFALSDFQIDWDNMEVTCPQGISTANWSDRPAESSIHVKFSSEDCRRCSVREYCTKGIGPRTIQFKEFDLFHELARFRQRQSKKKFKKLYDKRAGVEGTISQTIRQADSRRSRYVGLAKTHLQIVAAAVAVNFVRLSDWILDIPRAVTRKSVILALGA
jgi:transposase